MSATNNSDHPRSIALRAEIAEIEELIADLSPASRSRERQAEKLAALRAELATLEAGTTPAALPNFTGAQTGDVSIGDVVAGNQVEQHADQSN